MKILLSESTPVITDLRDKTNYVFTRTLAKIIYYVCVIFTVIGIIAFFPSNLFGGVDPKDAFISLFGGLLLFIVIKLAYESSSVFLDIGDASVANLSKTNESKTSIESSSFSSVVDELKKISEQNKKQTEALTKSIDKLSDKTEKTNTYLYHILSNMK